MYEYVREKEQNKELDASYYISHYTKRNILPAVYSSFADFFFISAGQLFRMMVREQKEVSINSLPSYFYQGMF